MISAVDRLRIAIALIALKHKPVDRSFASYALDLRAKFMPSGPSAPTSDHSWRTHALDLEKECAILKTQYEAERIKNLAIPENISVGLASAASQTPAASASDTGKKKQKKKGGNALPAPKRPEVIRLELKSLFDEGGNRGSDRSDPKIAEPNACLIAVDAFYRLASVYDAGNNMEDLLAATTLRAFQSISAELQRIIQADILLPRHPEIMETFSKLLQDVILVSLSLNAMKAPDSALSDPPASQQFGGTLSALLGIIMPLVVSFLPLSENYLQKLLKIPTNDVENATPIDIRYELLSFIRLTYSTLFPTSSNPPSDDNAPPPPVPGTGNKLLALDSLRMTLVLESVRELDRVLRGSSGNKGPYYGSKWEHHTPHLSTSSIRQSPVSCHNVHASPPSDDVDTRRRVRRLAVKDTLWFLCTLLQALSETGLSSITQTVLDEDSHQAPMMASSESKDMTLINAHNKALEPLRIATRDALLALVMHCRRGTYSSRCSAFSKTREKDAASFAQNPAPTTEGLETSIGGFKLQQDIAEDLPTDVDDGHNAKPQEARPVHIEDRQHMEEPSNEIEEYLIDEAGYGMILGIVEAFLIGTVAQSHRG